MDGGRAAGVRLRDGREWKARLAVVSNVDPYGTFIEMVGEEHLEQDFSQAVRAIEPDEFSYFQVHLALKAPLRFAVHEAADEAVGMAMNVNYGPRSGDDLKLMWNETRAGRVPRTLLLPCHLPDPVRPVAGAPGQAHPRRCSCRSPTNSRAGGREEWVSLKNDFMERVLSELRGVATNLTDDNIVMKVAMDPFYLAGRWQNMRRGSVWVGPEDGGPDGREPPYPATGPLPNAHPGALSGGRGHASRGRGHRRLRKGRVERPPAGPSPRKVNRPGELMHEGR